MPQGFPGACSEIQVPEQRQWWLQLVRDEVVQSLPHEGEVALSLLRPGLMSVPPVEMVLTSLLLALRLAGR